MTARTGERGEGLAIEQLRSALAGPFDLQASPGAVLTISGPSGAGKSLFLRMVADLDPNEGGVRLGGRRRSDMPAPQWRRLAPYVAAEPGWWSDAAADHFDTADRQRAAGLAEQLGVGRAQFDGPVGRLSTGERQRLALVRAFVLDPPILLLDEPTGPLDPLSVVRVEDMLRKRANAGTIVLMVSHDRGQGERLGAERHRMVQGRLEPEA